MVCFFSSTIAFDVDGKTRFYQFDIVSKAANAYEIAMTYFFLYTVRIDLLAYFPIFSIS